MRNECVSHAPFQLDELRKLQSAGLMPDGKNPRLRTTRLNLAHQRGTASMSTNRVLLTALALALLSAPTLAQDTKTDTKTAPAAGANNSATAPKPSTTGAATTPVTGKTNLNSATAGQLDKLPKMTPLHSKAIMEARGKARFKDWNDFVARKVVPADTAAAIKDVVTF